MQVNALTASYTGSQRQTQPEGYYEPKAAKKSFEDFLFSSDIPNVSDEEMEAALERAMARMELLMGAEVAETLINADGSINPARVAQAMSAADTPYSVSNRTTFTNAPQVVSLIA